MRDALERASVLTGAVVGALNLAIVRRKGNRRQIESWAAKLDEAAGLLRSAIQ